MTPDAPTTARFSVSYGAFARADVEAIEVAAFRRGLTCEAKYAGNWFGGCAAFKITGPEADVRAFVATLRSEQN